MVWLVSGFQSFLSLVREVRVADLAGYPKKMIDEIG